MRRIPLLLLCVTLFVTACEKDPEFPIPVGVQTVRAVLKPVPFSLKRRGTHALIAPDGKMAAYAESTAVNLRALEGREVELQGIFEKNSDPAALPVLVVQKVISSGEEDVRPWVIPALSLSLKLPRSWKGSIQGKSASFSASGFTLPILTISQRTVVNANPNPLYGPLPTLSSSDASAELLVVGRRKAHTLETETSWIVSVPLSPNDSGREYVFSFAFRSNLSTEDQRAAYRKILQTVEFTVSGAPSSVPKSSASVPSGLSSSDSGSNTSRASGEGAPCGGVAGILCPKGLYCKITEPISETGVCVRK